VPLRFEIELLRWESSREARATAASSENVGADGSTAVLLAQGVIAFPTVLTQVWCRGCPPLWQEAMKTAYRHGTEIKIVGLRSVTQGKLSAAALKGTVGSSVLVVSVQLTDSDELEAVVLRCVQRFVLMGGREVRTHADRLRMLDEASGNSVTAQPDPNMLAGETMVRLGAVTLIDDDGSDDGDDGCVVGDLGHPAHPFQQALAAFGRFYAVAGASPLWKAVARTLGAPYPHFARDAGASDLAAAKRLSFYLAAAVPVRFGFTGRQRLLATISALDRLMAVTEIMQSHPPVHRSHVVEVEATARRRRGNTIVMTPGSLQSICVDQVVESMGSEHAKLADLPPHLLNRVVNRMCDLQLTTHALCKQLAPLPVAALRLDAERSQHVTALRCSWLPTLQTMRSLVALDLTRCAELTDDVIGPALAQLPLLQRLSTERCRELTGAFLSSVAAPSEMTDLDVAGTQCTVCSLNAALAGMSKLDTLNVSGTRWNDENAMTLLPVIGSQLRSFSCESTRMSDSCTSVLPALANAANLSICFSEHLYDFEWITSLVTLVSLDLSLCARLEDEHLMFLAPLKHLKHLNISKTGVTDNGFRFLADLPLERIVAQGLGLTDAICFALEKMTLSHLDLSSCTGISDAIVSHLSRASLTTLKLPYRPTGSPLVTDRVVEQLASLGFAGLHTLSIGGKGITDGCVEQLAQLPDVLCTIHLWHTKMTASGIAQLQRLTGLSLDDSMRTSRGTYMLQE